MVSRFGLTVAVAAATFAALVNNGSYHLFARGFTAIVVWWVLAVAVAVGLAPRGRVPKIALAAMLALGGLTLWTALSIAWSDSAADSFEEFNRVALYFGVLCLVVLTTRRGEAGRWCDGIAIGIVGVALLALLNRFFPHLVGPETAPGFFAGEIRLSYPVNYWNGLAIVLGMAVPLLVRCAVVAPTLFVRGLAIAPIPALASAIYLTSSRGGVAVACVSSLVLLALASRRMLVAATLAVALGGSVLATLVLTARNDLVDGPLGTSAALSQGRSAAVLIVVICVAAGLSSAALSSLGIWRRSFSPGRRVKLGAAAGLIAVVVSATAIFNPTEKFNEFKQPSPSYSSEPTSATQAHLLSASGSGRWQLWKVAADEFAAYPLVGHGAGSYEAWWSEHATITKFVRDAHSLYLETLAELGLVGFVLLMLGIGSGLVAGARRLRASIRERVTVAALLAALAGWVVGAGIDWIWELTAATILGMVFLALLTGPATLASEDSTSDARSPRLGSAPRLAVGTLALVLIVAQAVPLLSQAKLRDSQAAVRRGNTAEALRSASDARSIEPWASAPYIQLALVSEQAKDLEAARRWIGKAQDHDRSNWRIWLIAARIDLKAGFIEAARQKLERARELNRRSPLFVTGAAQSDSQ